MSVWQTIRVAMRALMRNKTRSFLTTLGMIIGVAAVIAMVAVGEGAKQKVEDSFAAMGSNMLIVMPGTTTSGGAQGGFGSMPTLTWDDLRSIQTEVPTVKAATAVLRSTSQVIGEDQNWTTQVTGTGPEYFDIRNWPVSRGILFTQSDVDAGSKLVVLGQTVVDKLWGPSADPVGQSVRIRNIPFQVIGVAAKKGQSPMGQDYDDGVFIPVSTFRAKIQGGLKNYINGAIMVSATSADATSRAESQISNLLRDRHHVQAGTDDDFSIRNLTEMASAQQEGTKTFTTLLAVVAFVSLVVGGIGIMNIMLVSVTERTREIGLRMAVGAKPSNVLVQFVVEALALAVNGGLIGIAVGLIGAFVFAAKAHWPILVRVDIILLSVGVSGLTGLIFGIYPAYKASRLDPIDALRYE
ncbi:MAG TPA: ABC transporter permease [Polyangia bacterium]|nr:ABC transporter permease [Polyangia bacterium]